MSTHKHFDRICVVVLVLCLLLTLVFMNGSVLGLQAAAPVMGYESRLFDTAAVHTIDIVIDDWEGFLSTAQSEAYTVCDLLVDGEAFQNVGIRGKGNTSLSTVSSMDSERYSFKIEFDQYESGKTYHGQDKLSLNNLIQDSTYLKDYLTYRMMKEFGVAAPLCSFVWITVNGEDWGLYLAIEAVEDAFLQRNYGSGYGQLYKPDGMNMGGGRGNGKDFRLEDFDFETVEQPRPDHRQPGGQGGPMERPDMGGMGGNDARLQYIDDDPDSYSTIFDSAKTDIADADRARLIESLRQLSEGNAADALDIDAVLRYFVVHNYVVTGDSYTGSMIHNYYLYEADGRLSMIPWDYNLAFGTFQSNNANSAVNDDIDSPLSVTGSGDRPMVDWIFQNEAYTSQYHQYFSEFLNTVDPTAIIEEAAALIAPYVEQDPTAFYDYEEFETGVEALREFCRLRSESVANQLSDGGTVDASHLNLSDMGTMNMGGGFDRGDRFDSEPQMPGGNMPQMPDGMTFPMEGKPQRGNGFPNSTVPPQAGEALSGSVQSPLPLLISAAVLGFGLVFALLFKRRKKQVHNSSIERS